MHCASRVCSRDTTLMNGVTRSVLELTNVSGELSRSGDVDFQYRRPISMDLKGLSAFAARVGPNQGNKIGVLCSRWNSLVSFQVRNRNQALITNNQEQSCQCGCSDSGTQPTQPTADLDPLFLLLA